MRFLTLPVLLTFVIVAVGFACGAPFASDPELLGLVALGETAALAMPQSQVMREVFRSDPWQRIREDLPDFDNVVASGRASCTIPRYAMTLFGVMLKLGGTTFTKAMITEVRLRLGSKTIWFATATDLQSINNYFALDPNRATFLWVPFTAPKSKSKGAEFIGGLDMAKLGEGVLKLEVLTSGATAPTLKGKATWGPVQGNDLIAKILQFTWSSGGGTGRRMVPLNFNGAIVQWVGFKFTGTDWAASAAATPWTGNTGDGAMGAITVSAGCKIGTHKIVVVEPGANVGTFIHEDPDGILVSKKGVVASAYSAGGLAFTLADGGTDFLAGDGFDIVVADNSDGNVNRVEVKRDGRTVWDYEGDEARFLEQSYGRVPQANFYFVDFEVDNYPDGALRTAGAASIEWYAHLTASDNLTIYAGIIDTPANNTN